MTRSAEGTVRAPGRNVRAEGRAEPGDPAPGWGLLARRLEDKAPGRVEKIHPAFTSQRCSACGHIAAESRKSQALFRCVACGYTCNADVNAARNGTSMPDGVNCGDSCHDGGHACREPLPEAVVLA